MCEQDLPVGVACIPAAVWLLVPVLFYRACHVIVEVVHTVFVRENLFNHHSVSPVRLLVAYPCQGVGPVSSQPTRAAVPTMAIIKDRTGFQCIRQRP